MRVSGRSIIQKYIEYTERFYDIENFSVDKRRDYTKKFIGYTAQKLKARISILFFPKVVFKRRNLFQGHRYTEIIRLHDPVDCGLIGGWSDLCHAFRNGYGFVWAGGIIAAFELALHVGEYRYLERIIQGLSHAEITANSRRLVYLYEDTQPLGLTLSSVYRKSVKISTVCIAHGFFPNNRANLVFEGNNSHYNFVWDLSQRKFFDESKTKVIELGIPYDYKLVSSVNAERVVLLGHSGPETNLSEYFLTYGHLLYVYNVLKKSGLSVKFKPHPQDDKEYAAKIFQADVIQDLYDEIKSGSVIAGFISSALYEAKMHGTITIGLDTQQLSYDRSFDVDKAFLYEQYSNIPAFLKSLSSETGKEKKIMIDSLKKRFSSSVSQLY